MGKYSLKGSPAFDELIDRHMQRITDEVWSSSYSKHWRALVLIGAYGRGEGARLIDNDGAEKPFGDYDLVLVTNKIAPLIQSAANHLEKRLSAGLGLTVNLSLYLKKKLHTCEFSLINYEIKHGHMVIRGDEKVLDRMPDYPRGGIPLSEGTRRLMNHGRLLLDMKRRTAVNKPLTEEERRRFIQFIFKTNLAFGDCALLIRNAYDSSCAVKKQRISNLDLAGLDHARALLNTCLRAIEFNEYGDLQSLKSINVHMWLDEAIRNFQSFFLWYEQRALNRKFRDTKKYARAFPNLGNEGSPLKNAVLNLRVFGSGELPNLFVHPRIRLYAVITLLLSDHPALPEICRLLRCREAKFEALCDEFSWLQQRVG